MQTLYLSKNQLQSLVGLQQFVGLTTLSVADNLLTDWDVLDGLGSLEPTLENACFEGNPMASLPNHRFQAIGPTAYCKT